MDTTDFVPLKQPAAAGKKQQLRGLGMQPVKLKPKRGRSTKKQKRRQAAKLDKVSFCFLPCTLQQRSMHAVHWEYTDPILFLVLGHGCC